MATALAQSTNLVSLAPTLISSQSKRTNGSSRNRSSTTICVSQQADTPPRFNLNFSSRQRSGKALVSDIKLHFQQVQHEEQQHCDSVVEDEDVDDLIMTQILGFIDGRCPEPAPNSLLHFRWKQVDSTVKSWILAAMSSDLVAGYMYNLSSKQLWDDLAEKYGGMSTTYSSSSKTIGGDTSGNNTALAVKPLSKPGGTFHNGQVNKLIGNNNWKRRSDGVIDTRWCTFCQRPGHEKENCFKITGYPEWFKPKTGQGFGNNGAFNNSSGGNANTRAFANAAEVESPLDAGRNTVGDVQLMAKQISNLQQEFNRLLKGKDPLGDQTQHFANFAYMQDFADIKLHFQQVQHEEQQHCDSVVEDEDVDDLIMTRILENELIREGECVGALVAKILREILKGDDLGEIQTWMKEMVFSAVELGLSTYAEMDDGGNIFEKYCTNMTQLAKQGRLDPVIGRQEQIEGA
ncbi:OLC1v1000780C1 [Oldenlandia corymbosa var. corymbosa]|uniref:OLC1v1000780C1 n=1 Tax=Oldenlandia corymbosa var. corymbosa TaxID=529605 RepID=A0AAV1D3S5_OLDCO|nr:OLC1v1000780C1 [Oldenlandia corymbosa var. corymbosa]